MLTLHKNNNNINLYSPNDDWSGKRSVEIEHEIVEFKKDSFIRIWYNEQNECYPVHWHTALEIILPIENYYDVNIANSKYHIMPGEFLLITPGENHQLIAPESGNRYIFLLDLSAISKLSGFSTIQSLMSEPLLITKEAYAHVYEELYQLLAHIRYEYFSQNDFCVLNIYSLLISFFVILGRNRISTSDIFPNVRVYKQKEYVQKFSDALDYIGAHYMEELTLDDIADEVGFSKYHFTRLFKQYTNSTFSNYLSHKRINAAEELLAEPDLSITEIALQSGFSSISTFNRIFKQQKDCTPSEYRALYSKIHYTL